MELDFLIDHKGKCAPVEVKAKTAKVKRMSTAVKHPEKYHVFQALKFDDNNVGRGLLTLPAYMEFLLALEPDELVLKPVDATSMNAMVNDFVKR